MTEPLIDFDGTVYVGIGPRPVTFTDPAQQVRTERIGEDYFIAVARIAIPLRALTLLWRDIVDELRPAAEAWLAMLPNERPTPPNDPRARALWLRQHRNTGPVQHRQRAPRSLPAGRCR